MLSLRALNGETVLGGSTPHGACCFSCLALVPLPWNLLGESFSFPLKPLG